MLLARDPELAARARYLSTQAKDDPIAYIHGTVGFNYRLTNVQAAIGCAQVEQLDDFVGRKREIAARYREAFAGLQGVRPMLEAPWARSTFWLYTIRLDPQLGVDPDGLVHALGERRIQARPVWQPMHLSPAHSADGSPPCPTAEEVHRTAVSLPCSTNLCAEDQDRVIEAVHEIVTAG